MAACVTNHILTTSAHSSCLTVVILRASGMASNHQSYSLTVDALRQDTKVLPHQQHVRPRAIPLVTATRTGISITGHLLCQHFVPMYKYMKSIVIISFEINKDD